MSEVYIDPFIPGELLSEFDDSAREVHARLASQSFDEVLKDMPLAKEMTLGDRRMRYGEILPDGDYDENKVLALHFPFANGWQPHMYLRAKATQEIAAPDMRLIAFFGHRLGKKAYDLTKDEMAKVAQGDFSPVAELEARLLIGLGLGWVAIENYSGYSGGASNGAALGRIAASHARVHSLGMFEVPNAKARTRKALSKDFKKTGMGPFMQAVIGAQIPSLNKAMGVHNIHNPFERFAGPVDINVPGKILFALAGFGLSSVLIAENRAIRSGMTQDNLAELIKPILDAQPDTQVLLGNMERSLIMPTPDLDRHHSELHELYGDNVQKVTVGHYGHEGGDNIVVHALLVKKSLDQGRS